MQRRRRRLYGEPPPYPCFEFGRLGLWRSGRCFRGNKSTLFRPFREFLNIQCAHCWGGGVGQFELTGTKEVGGSGTQNE